LLFDVRFRGLPGTFDVTNDGAGSGIGFGGKSTPV